MAASLPDTVPFVGPEAQERARGRSFHARLGANESPFGPSPNAIAAMRDAAAEAWMYPDPESHDLRHAIAAAEGVAADQIVVGAGIDGLLGSAVRLFVSPGDPVVTSDGAYPTFNYHVTGFGGLLSKVPYRNDHEDLEGLSARVSETGARVVYLSNPDNPMGSFHSPERISEFAEGLPDDCLLLLDEAYRECADVPTSLAQSSFRNNILRFGTFSKAYGLAGARVGYAVGPREIIDAFARVRNHFGISRVSQTGALAALLDQDHLAIVKRGIAESVERLCAIACDNGLTPLPTATNFVTMDCRGDGNRARAILDALAQRRVFVRMPGVAPLNRCIRVTCGPTNQMDIFAEILPMALEDACINGA